MKVNRLAGCCLMLVFSGAGCAHSDVAAPARLKYRERSAPRPSGACLDLPTPNTARVVEETASHAKDTVHGRVLLPNGDDAGGLAVNIGEMRTLTAADGSFVLHDVPATYDLIIADPDRRRVTAYQALTRRDPIVLHTAHDTSKVKGHCSQASISGRLQWDGPTAGDRGEPVIYFFSRTAFAEGTATSTRGYGPLSVDWLGDTAANGTIIALAHGSATAHLAATSVTLAKGEARQQDLRLSPVPMGAIAGSLGTRTFYPDRVRASYALPGSAERIDLGDCAVSKRGTFECIVPDLSSLGGEYCVSQRPSGPKRFLANRCGAKIGAKDFLVEPAPWDIQLRSVDLAPPKLRLSPSDRETLSSAMATWTATGARVYQLDIGHCAMGTCATVYLARTTFSWSELHALDLKYHPLIEKVLVVSAIHPYKTTDDLAGGDDPLGQRASWHRVEAEGAPLTLPWFTEDDPSDDAPAFHVAKTLNWEDVGNLSACTSASESIPVSELGPTRAETQVRVRGILTAHSCDMDPLDMAKVGGRSEQNQRCWCEWILEDPRGEFRPVDFHPEFISDYGAHCGEPRAPRVDVIVTGTVVPCGGFGVCGDGLPFCPADYCLADVSLCAVR